MSKSISNVPQSKNGMINGQIRAAILGSGFLFLFIVLFFAIGFGKAFTLLFVNKIQFRFLIPEIKILSVKPQFINLILYFSLSLFPKKNCKRQYFGQKQLD